MHEKQLILTDEPRAFLEQLDARAKLLALAVWAVCIVTIPRGRYALFAIYAVILVALLALNQRLWPKFARRFAPPLPAIALLVLLLPFFKAGEPVWHWGPLNLTREGMQTAARVGSAAILCVGGIMLVWASTPEESLLIGLRGLGLPRVFVGVLGFMLRYLEVLRPELHRLTDARAARSISTAGPGRVSSGANLLGTLFLRAHERAEHVADAMAARGYTGRLRSYAHSHLHARDIVVAIAFPLAVILVRFAAGAA